MVRCVCVGNPTTSTFDESDIKGASIKQTITGMNCTYSIACKSVDGAKEVSCCDKFDPAANGEKIWSDLKENGKLTEKSVDEHLKSMFINILFLFICGNVFHTYIYVAFAIITAKDIGVAVCGQVTVQPQTYDDLEFALAWDMPVINFHKKIKQYTRFVISITSFAYSK